MASLYREDPAALQADIRDVLDAVRRDAPWLCLAPGTPERYVAAVMDARELERGEG